MYGIIADYVIRAGKALKLHVVQLDLADLASVKDFAQRVQTLLGPKKIDALVSCLPCCRHAVSTAALFKENGTYWQVQLHFKQSSELSTTMALDCLALGKGQEIFGLINVMMESPAGQQRWCADRPISAVQTRP